MSIPVNVDEQSDDVNQLIKNTEELFMTNKYSGWRTKCLSISIFKYTN